MPRRILLALILVTLAPTPALAALEVYCHGNGDFVAQVFRAVTMVVGDSSYQTLLNLVMVTSALFLVYWIAFVKPGYLGEMVRWFGLCMVFYYVLLVPKVDVAINDTINPTNITVVQGVPYGLGMFGHFFSSVEKWLTDKTEQAFSLPNDLKYANNGYAYSVMLLNASRRIEVADPYLRRSLQDYFCNCSFYDLMDGSLNLDAVRRSDNLWNAVRTDSSRFTPVYSAADPRGTVQQCKDAWPTIDAMLQNHTPVLEREFETAIRGSFTGVIGGHLADSYSYLAGVARSGKDIILQNAAINSFDDALIQSAASAGLDPRAMGLATAQSEVELRNGWVAAGELAKKYIPIIRNVVEGFVYGLSCVVFLMVFLPFGVVIFRFYMTLLLWLALWGPLFAILNLLVNSEAAKVIGNTTGTLGYSLSLASHHFITTSTYDVIAAAGYLAWLVPMLAFALAKGSEYALVSFVGKLAGGAAGTAEREGQSVAKGSVSMGNVSMEDFRGYNTSMWNKNLRPSMATGGSVSEGHQMSRYGSESSPVVHAPADSVGNLRFSSSMGQVQSLKESASEASSRATAAMDMAMTAAGTVVSTADRLTKGAQKGLTYRDGTSLQDSVASSRSLHALSSMRETFKSELGVDDSAAANFTQMAMTMKQAGVGASASIPLLDKLGLKVGADGRISYQSGGGWRTTDARTFREAMGKAMNLASGVDYSEMQQLTSRAAHDSGVASSLGISENTSHSLDHVESEMGRSVKQAREELRQAEQYSSAADRVASVGKHGTADLMPYVIDRAAEAWSVTRDQAAGRLRDMATRDPEGAMATVAGLVADGDLGGLQAYVVTRVGASLKEGRQEAAESRNELGERKAGVDQESHALATRQRPSQAAAARSLGLPGKKAAVEGRYSEARKETALQVDSGKEGVRGQIEDANRGSEGWAKDAQGAIEHGRPQLAEPLSKKDLKPLDY